MTNMYREVYEKRNFEQCPFCIWTVAHKDDIIYETENYYLTINHFPYTRHHLLIAPKKHITSLIDEESNTEKEYLTKQAGKIFLNMGLENYVVLDRSGEKSGMSIKHIHRHIIPMNDPNDLLYNMSQITEEINFKGDIATYQNILTPV